MLKSVSHDVHSERMHRDPDVVELDFAKVRAMLRRQVLVLGLGCALGLGLGLVYVFTAAPFYTAYSQILIDNRSQVAAGDPLASNLSAEVVDSHLAVIRSEKIGLRVVESAGLDEDPSFLNPPAGSFFSVALATLTQFLDFRSWLRSGEEAAVVSKGGLKHAAFRKLQSNLEVRRLPGTYVVEVGYTSPDRVEAAEIANAVAEAYLTDQLETRYEMMRRAGDWLQQRAGELQGPAREADLAVQRFRAENNLIVANGKLVSDQQLSEISSQLIIARAETASARARYERIKQIIDSGQKDAIVGGALDQPIFNTLRTNYLAAAKRVTDLGGKLGAEHPQVQQLQDEMLAYERLMLEELRRIGESYYSDLEVARSREESLQQSLNNALGVTAAANETLVSLRELESRAAIYRTMLDNFQARFEEATQQQSFPIINARVITAATAPTSPSYPSKPLALAISLMLGSALGVAFGIYREYSDDAFRTGQQVRKELGLEFLGMLPRLRRQYNTLSRETTTGSLPANCFAAPSAMRYAIDNPHSGFAETLRRIKVAADTALQCNGSGSKGGVIGIVSTLPGEGKSTTAFNLAAMLAHQGKRTLLIDADIRNPAITRQMTPKAQLGLVDHLIGGTPLGLCQLEEVNCGMKFLPCVVKKRIAHSAEMIASPAMKALLRQATQVYDYIILDCPPLNPVVDVRAAAEIFDGFVYVLEWGSTPRAAVVDTLIAEAKVYERCLGFVLNKVDLRKLATFEDYTSSNYSIDG